MIDFISGILTKKSPGSAILDVHGIGYKLAITLHSFDQLPECGSPCTFLTYLHIREDAWSLYGFMQERERDMFLQFISISGIGPRMALNILSSRDADHLRALIISGDVFSLTKIPGIGKKTAERIVLELREKIISATGDTTLIQDPIRQPEREEAIMALIALGYPRTASEKAVQLAFDDAKDSSLSLSELIRAALKKVF